MSNLSWTLKSESYTSYIAATVKLQLYRNLTARLRRVVFTVFRRRVQRICSLTFVCLLSDTDVCICR